MRIGFDCRPLLSPRAGVAQHAVALLRAVRRLSHHDLVCFYNTWNPRLVPHLERWRDPRIHTRLWTLMPNQLLSTLWMSHCGWLLPADLLCGRLDLFHAFDHVVPTLRRGRVTSTIHDLSTLRLPETHTRAQVELLSLARLQRACQRSDRLFTVSEFSRREMVELLGVKEEHVTVVYNAPAEYVRPVHDLGILAATRRRYGLRAPYVLAVGTLEPRKNLTRLIEAFVQVRDELQPRPQLVLCGARGWKTAPILDLVRRHARGGDLVHLGYVPGDDLAALYSGATVVAYVSLYEGFGMPAVEAMRCGAPVLASRDTVLEEVVGDAGLLVEPQEVDAIAAGLRQLLQDEGLRTTLQRRGRERAAHFSWDRAARTMLGAWESLA